MIVHQITTGNEAITECKRETFGITLALRWGDWCHPTGPGNWFQEPYFKTMWRFYTSIPCPWISWNIFGWKGYLGAKVYGAECNDRPQDPGLWHWIPAEDVYPGSQAIMFSGRLVIGD